MAKKVVAVVLRCSKCPKWYRLSGSVRGICLKQNRKETLYNDECHVNFVPAVVTVGV